MKKLLVLILCAALLSACSAEFNENRSKAIDMRQTLRVELFNKCLEKVPKAPTSMGKSDWSKIVGACDNAAYYQSARD
jgi:hypothetical protein